MSQGFTSQLPIPLPVAQGGTGLTSTTAYAVVCGGTTSTGNLQSIASVGTSGQVLTSNGAGALPTFTTLQSGNVRAWVNFNGTGTVAIRSSGNVTSITDGGVGIYTVNFTSNLASANYAVGLGGSQDGFTASLGYGIGTFGPLVSSCSLACLSIVGAYADFQFVTATFVL
jgi:hypothetical protein